MTVFPLPVRERSAIRSDPSLQSTPPHGPELI